MPGQPVKLDFTDTRYVSGPVANGQLVVPDTTKTPDEFGKLPVKVAGANATNVIGVARLSATNAANPDTTFTMQRKSISIFRKAAAWVVFAATAEEGDPLVAAADGKVTPAAGGATFGQIIGSCAQRVTAANTEGLAYIDRP